MRHLGFLLCVGCIFLTIHSNAQRGGDQISPKESIGKSPGVSKDEDGKQLYDIFFGNNQIGEYTVWKMEKEGGIEYHAISESKVRFFGQITIKYNLVCVYKGRELISSKMQFYKNGKLRGETITKKSGSQYEIIKDGRSSKSASPIHNSTIQLHFDLPNIGNMYYSESEARMKEINLVQNQEFLLTDPGNKKETSYVYQDNILRAVNVEFVMGDFSVIRK